MLPEWGLGHCSASSCNCLQLQPYLPPEPTSRQAQGTEGELLIFPPCVVEQQIKYDFLYAVCHYNMYFLARGPLYVCATCLTHVQGANTVLFLVRKKPQHKPNQFIYLSCQNVQTYYSGNSSHLLDEI